MPAMGGVASSHPRIVGLVSNRTAPVGNRCHCGGPPGPANRATDHGVELDPELLRIGPCWRIPLLGVVSVMTGLQRQIVESCAAIWNRQGSMPIDGGVSEG
jgi:hypothetical protein